MEYCPLDQAFEITPIPKQKKEEKKKHKKQKSSLEFLDPNFNPSAVDSDRPAGKLSELLSLKDLKEAFTDISSNIVLPKTGLTKLPEYFTGNDDTSEGFVSSFTQGEKEETKQLPLPSVDDVWKPLTPSTANTSYFKSLPTPGGTYPVWNSSSTLAPVASKKSNSDTAISDLNKKISTLIQRLDALEKEYSSSKESSKQEVLLFVGTGLAVIFGLHLFRFH